jgi:hypothetical protein
VGEKKRGRVVGNVGTVGNQHQLRPRRGRDPLVSRDEDYVV